MKFKKRGVTVLKQKILSLGFNKSMIICGCANGLQTSVDLEGLIKEESKVGNYDIMQVITKNDLRDC